METLKAGADPSECVFVEALQAVVRTGYRALGARAFDIRTDEGVVHGFRFPCRGECIGPPVVMLHGLGDTSTTWYRMIWPLSAGHTVIMLDLPGHGRSQVSEDDFPPPSVKASILADAIDELDIEPVALVGTSLGAWVAMHLAIQRPDLLDRLVLVAPAGVLHPGAVRAREFLQPQSAKEVLDLWRRMWHQLPSGASLFARGSLDHYDDETVRALLYETTAEEVLGPAQLRQLSHPTLVIWGHDDGLLPSETPGLIRDYAPGDVSVTWLARCGHMPQQERAGDLAHRISDFVRGASSGPGAGPA